MDIEEVRDYVLSLQYVTEDQPFGEDIITYRIEGKIFLCLWLGGPNYDYPRFAIKLSPERNEELRDQYSSITPAWHWNKRHWSDIYYESMDGFLVKSLIKESYQLVFNKYGNIHRKTRTK